MYQRVSIYGTADKLHVKLITGNKKAAVTVLNNYGFDMEIVVHRSRDLVSNRVLELLNSKNKEGDE